jgi:hypothetical protein
MTMKKIAALAVLAAALPVPVHANDFPNVARVPQAVFHDLAQDLGAAFAYKGVTPATPLGLTGFDVGIEVTDTKMRNAAAFASAGADRRSHLVIPKFHVHKGLIAGFDIGAFVAGAPEIDARLFGGELRYAILDDGLATPALGLRLSGSRASGLGDLRVSTAAADLMLSKRFALITPYAGAGVVRVQSSVAGSALAEERFNKSRLFGGVNLNLLAVNLAFEAEKLGSNTSLSAKAGWRF